MSGHFYDDMMRSALKGMYQPPNDTQPQPQQRRSVVLDGADDYADRDIAIRAIATVQEWAETDPDDLDDGETLPDRLLAMLSGMANEDFDGEIGSDEEVIISSALEHVSDYLQSVGVDADDVDALLNEWDEDAAERVMDFLVSEMPDDPDGELLDSIVFDATYRKTTAIRNGKKVRINKRVGGSVRLSPKQKAALKKARRRAQSPQAMARRLKSNRMRKRLGM